MGHRKKTRGPSAWAEAAFWTDEEEMEGCRDKSSSVPHSKVVGKGKSRDRKKGRELVDKRLGPQEDAAGEESASATQEAPSGVEEQLWSAVQQGKGKIHRRAEEKVRVQTMVPKSLLDIFAGSISADVLETVFESSGHSLEATVEALLSMTEEATSAEPSPLPSMSTDGASTSGTSEAQLEAPDLWDNLPEECKQLVLEKLSPLDAARAARVSLDFAVYLRNLRSHATHLAIPASITKVDHILGFLRAFPNVSSLNFRKCRTTLPPMARWSIFHRLYVQNDRPEGAKPTKSIDLGGITNLDSFDVQFLCENGELTHLDLSNTSIDDAALKILAKFPFSANPLVEALRSGGAQPMQSGLRRLNLAGCLWMTDAGLVAVIESSTVKPTLEVLDISNCPALTRGAVKHATVQTLAAVGVFWERFVAIYGPERPLQDLNLAQSSKLTEVNLAAPNLVALNLSGCSALTKLDLCCPKLQTLKLAQCSSLEEVGSMQCPSLRKLSLFQCRQLRSDALSDVLTGTPLLDELNCSGCAALFGLDLAANVQLTRLDVSGCSRLNRLTVTSPELVFLSARGCSQLVELRLDSHQLESLLLSNCKLLREVRLPALVNMRCEEETSRQRFQVDLSGCSVLPDFLLQNLLSVGRRRSGG